MRLVLDTDGVRVGLQSAGGASRLLLCGIVEKAFVPVMTVANALEYEDVLARPQSLAATGLSVNETVDFIDGLIACSAWIAILDRIRPSIRDPSDEIFVEACLYGRCAAIVTFNHRDYRAADERLAARGTGPVPTISPGDALRRLPWRPMAATPFAFPRP